jgi:hypothetical protein
MYITTLNSGLGLRTDRLSSQADAWLSVDPRLGATNWTARNRSRRAIHRPRNRQSMKGITGSGERVICLSCDGSSGDTLNIITRTLRRRLVRPRKLSHCCCSPSPAVSHTSTQAAARQNAGGYDAPCRAAACKLQAASCKLRETQDMTDSQKPGNLPRFHTPGSNSAMHALFPFSSAVVPSQSYDGPCP